MRAAAAGLRRRSARSPCSAWSGAAPPARRVAGTFGAAAGRTAASRRPLWQHFVAARSASCNLTLADRIVNATGLDALLPDVFEARASCADAAVVLLGVPYEFWSGALFGAIGVLMVVRPAPRLKGTARAAHSIGVCSATSSLIASSSANTAVSE